MIEQEMTLSSIGMYAGMPKTKKLMKQLASFMLVENGKPLGPRLTTVREYGRWMQEYFDEYTCNQELYMRAVRDGQAVLTYHPGTRIGSYFDSTPLEKSELKCWYIWQSSVVTTQLVKMHFAEFRDCAPTKTEDGKSIPMLRVYTVPQIEFYIRNTMNKDFVFTDDMLHTPKQIALKGNDSKMLIMPKQEKRKSLLEKASKKHSEVGEIKIIDEEPRKLTLQQIEQELGYKIQLIQ